MTGTNATRTIPASLSHFAIFNPTLKPSHAATKSPLQRDDSTAQEGGEKAGGGAAQGEEDRDRDLEDDLKEAAQILFYTSRSSQTVSRDTMLKQTGLVKGLMGFSDMLIPSRPLISFSSPDYPAACAATTNPTDDEDKVGYISIRSAKTRMLVWSPEPDFYIYVNVTLALVVSEDGEKEPAQTAQGLSDRAIVQALERGYEDFRLLYGPLNQLLPPSHALSSVLERFWTKFAFTFENDIISASPSLSLSLPAHSSPDTRVSQAVDRALEVFIEDSDLPTTVDYGVINHLGPLCDSVPDAALCRFLSRLVVATLPPPVDIVKSDARHTLGLGRRDPGARDRKTSWGAGLGSWVPSLPGLTPRSLTPVSASAPSAVPSVKEGASRSGDKEKDAKGKWGFGMPSLAFGEAMGSMGGVFGLGGTAKSAGGRGVPAPEVVTATTVVTSSHLETDNNPTVSVADVAEARMEEADGMAHSANDEMALEREQGEGLTEAVSARLHEATIADSASHVSQTSVDVEDLQSAVEADEEIELGWEKRTVHTASASEAGQWVARRLSWIIRENILLFVLHPAGAAAPFELPGPRATLSLYSKLNTILSPDQTSPVSHESPKHPPTGNSTVVIHDDSTEVQGPEIDPASAASLGELRDALHRDKTIHEVYARTAGSRFIISKRLGPGHARSDPADEVHLAVERKDANLPDAEHAVRSFLRQRQEATTG